MKVSSKLGNQEKLEEFWETYFLKNHKTNLNCLEHTISRNIGVNNSSIKDSEENEEHERENLNHFSKYLNPKEQTLSWYIYVKGAAGEDSGGDKKHSIRN